MLVWGENRCNQLGLNLDSDDITDFPTPMSLNVQVGSLALAMVIAHFAHRAQWEIKDIKCGREHTAALTTSGKVLTWGSGGNSGRLGLRSDRDCDATVPTLVRAAVQMIVPQIA